MSNPTQPPTIIGYVLDPVHREGIMKKLGHFPYHEIHDVMKVLEQLPSLEDRGGEEKQESEAEPVDSGSGSE